MDYCILCKSALINAVRVIAKTPKIMMEYIQVEKVIFSILNGFIKLTNTIEEPKQTTIFENTEIVCCSKCASSSSLVQSIMGEEEQQYIETPTEILVQKGKWESTTQRLADMRNYVNSESVQGEK